MIILELIFLFLAIGLTLVDCLAHYRNRRDNQRFVEEHRDHPLINEIANELHVAIPERAFEAMPITSMTQHEIEEKKQEETKTQERNVSEGAFRLLPFELSQR